MQLIIEKNFNLKIKKKEKLVTNSLLMCKSNFVPTIVNKKSNKNKLVTSHYWEQFIIINLFNIHEYNESQKKSGKILLLHDPSPYNWLVKKFADIGNLVELDANIDFSHIEKKNDNIR